MTFYPLIKPLVFALPSETAHNLAIWGLKHGLFIGKPRSHKALLQNICGVDFPNPIGLSAGFDKNAEAYHTLSRAGFGFVEAGTVTPLAQSGNPKPRLFRLSKDKAIINRLGFNNKGADYFASQLGKKIHGSAAFGINIGRNKISENGSADYVTLLNRFIGSANYMTVNISSPNTPGLRDMQQEDELHALLKDVAGAKKASNSTTPIFLKVAPDIAQEQIPVIVSAVKANGIDGIIVSNTTLSREGLQEEALAKETGGMSGQPLFEKSTEVLKAFYLETKGEIPLIGVGGISNAEQAYAKIKAGASLVQIYTALIYEGLGVVERIKSDLVKLLEADGYSHISEAIGKDV